jgi:hypothetical protein
LQRGQASDEVTATAVLACRRRLHARMTSAEVAEQPDLGAMVDVFDGDA